jgi:uncharacterized damage-inducible protein DinB
VNRTFVEQTWDYFRVVNGIGLRAIAALPEGSLDQAPIAGMRTVKELVFHLYQMVRDTPQSVARGEAAAPDPAVETAELAGLRSKADLLAWCGRCWETGNQVVPTLTDAQIQGMVKTPWGQDFPGFVMMDILYNEYWHHRGQLYVYLRALGVEPPMLYDYENNAPAFRQKAPPQAS